MALKFAVNNSLSAVTSLPTAIPTGSMTLLQTQTASSSSTIEFTSNIDSTYDSYIFKGIDVHPANDDNFLVFNFSTDGGSNYNVTKTTTHVRVRHDEDGTDGSIGYQANQDLAQSTSDARFTFVGNDNDQATSFMLQLYNPSSTTFVKHFMADGVGVEEADRCYRTITAGYGNTTSAIDAITFKFSSGAIESGTFKMYGVK